MKRRKINRNILYIKNRIFKMIKSYELFFLNSIIKYNHVEDHHFVTIAVVL